MVVNAVSVSRRLTVECATVRARRWVRVAICKQRCAVMRCAAMRCDAPARRTLELHFASSYVARMLRLCVRQCEAIAVQGARYMRRYVWWVAGGRMSVAVVVVMVVVGSEERNGEGTDAEAGKLMSYGHGREGATCS